MTQISVMMMVVEGSPKMARIGKSLSYITNKNTMIFSIIFWSIAPYFRTRYLPTLKE